MTILDAANPVHQRAQQKLEHDLIAWITTIAKDATPRAVPVWFLWHDGRVLITTEPRAGKVAQIRRGSPVLIHLESGEFGNDVVILHGSAEISERSTSEWFTDIGADYKTKYAAAIIDYGAPIDEIIQQFSTVIVFTPERLQAW